MKNKIDYQQEYYKNKLEGGNIIASLIIFGAIFLALIFFGTVSYQILSRVF